MGRIEFVNALPLSVLERDYVVLPSLSSPPCLPTPPPPPSCPCPPRRRGSLTKCGRPPLPPPPHSLPPGKAPQHGRGHSGGRDLNAGAGDEDASNNDNDDNDDDENNVNGGGIELQQRAPSLPASSQFYTSLETAASMPPADLAACFELVRATSAAMYKRATGRWAPAQKRREMRLPDMRYLLVRRRTVPTPPPPPPPPPTSAIITTASAPFLPPPPDDDSGGDPVAASKLRGPAFAAAAAAAAASDVAGSEKDGADTSAALEDGEREVDDCSPSLSSKEEKKKKEGEREGLCAVAADVPEKEGEKEADNGNGADDAAPAKRRRRGTNNNNSNSSANSSANDSNSASSSTVEGFLSFMFTYEDGHEVVYCYELHLAERLRGRGWGAALMHAMEAAGARAGVARAMLTVFVANRRALHFYWKRG